MTNTNDYRLSYDNRMSLGTILLLNSPSLMQFGIDFSNWTIGAKFMGIKLLPKGVHYLSYALKDEDYQSKQGFFILIDSNQNNVIREWSDKYQRFIPLKPENEKNYQIGLDNLDFDQYLGDYPIDQYSNWKDVSSFITQGIMDKLDPISYKYLTLNNEYDEHKNNNGNGNDVKLSETIYFTSINQLFKVYSIKSESNNQVNNDISQRNQLTKDNIDKSKLVKEVIDKEYKGNADFLLGELQYAFIVFLLGESYDGLVQWKDMLTLIMSCESAIVGYDKLYCNFIEVLYHQLRNCPKDMFSDAIIGNNFLRRLFEHFFFESKVELKSSNAFTKRVELFNKFLKENFDYKIQSEETVTIDRYLNKEYIPSLDDIDDELPVIVSQEEIDESKLRINSKMDLD